MDVVSLRKEISEIKEEAQPHLAASEGHHERLFEVFRQIDEAIGADNKDGSASDEKTAGLIEAQTVVLRTTASLPARCMRDLLYKLAMWRWDAADLDQPMEEMNRSDAVVYSAFLDLVAMLGERDVLKEFDRAS